MPPVRPSRPPVQALPISVSVSQRFRVPERRPSLSCSLVNKAADGQRIKRKESLRPPACLPAWCRSAVHLEATSGSPAKVGRRRRCESVTLAKLTLTFVQSRRRANQDHNQLFHIKAGNKKKRDQGFFCISRARSGLRDVIQPLFYCAVHTCR